MRSPTNLKGPIGKHITSQNFIFSRCRRVTVIDTYRRYIVSKPGHLQFVAELLDMRGYFNLR